MRLRVVVACAVVVALAGAGSVLQPVAAAAKGEKLVFENERVRVLEFVLEPGVPMGMHDHPRDRVEITLGAGRVRVTTADGRTEEVDEQEGVVFSKASAARHDVVNVGKTVVRAFHVELK